MTYKIIHIAPFDIGCSFLGYEYRERRRREQFIKKVTVTCQESGFEVLNPLGGEYLFSVRINECVLCHLLEWGVGVFIFKNLEVVSSDDLNALKKYFIGEVYLACEMYYRKKKEQAAILEQQTNIIKPIKTFMDIIWRVVSKKDRVYSASADYKHNGLSYVLSIYYLEDSIDDKMSGNSKLVDLLMNPAVMGKITDKGQWVSIQEKICRYSSKGYSYSMYSDSSIISASWSAVVLIEEANVGVIDDIIDYEIKLQASWFLFDCLSDNMKMMKMSYLNLQKERSLSAYVSLEISNILSANMETGKKQVFESIRDTSGFETLKNKVQLFLENQILISEAKITQKQSMYSVFTEILLLLFTLISIYEPVKNLLFAKMEIEDVIMLIVLSIVFGICALLIIGKGDKV